MLDMVSAHSHKLQLGHEDRYTNPLDIDLSDLELQILC